METRRGFKFYRHQEDAPSGAQVDAVGPLPEAVGSGRVGAAAQVSLAARSAFQEALVTEHHDGTLPATATWLPLLAVYILALVAWMPLARLACWAVLWVAYTTGQTPDPPPAYTAWAP